MKEFIEGLPTPKRQRFSLLAGAIREASAAGQDVPSEPTEYAFGVDKRVVGARHTAKNRVLHLAFRPATTAGR